MYGNTMLSNFTAQKGFKGSRGDEEREQNIREAKAAHRRVHYAAGGTADLDILLDDLKTTYDSLSAEEESELQRMIGGREGFNEGGQFVRGPYDKEEYHQARLDQQEHIRKNRLVSKEAQMSQMMGEGYRDPRFIATTGNLLIDKWGLHPFADEDSGQVLSAKQMNVKGPTKD